jgi:hypothetical protein
MAVKGFKDNMVIKYIKMAPMMPDILHSTYLLNENKSLSLVYL